MRHYSKIDLPIPILICMALLYPIVDDLAADMEFSPDLLIIMGPATLLLALLLVCFLPVYYQIEASVLIIRAGFLRTSVPISQITKVQPTWNLLSAPALSLDRLEIKYSPDGVLGEIALVSPKDKKKFIADLARSDPELIIQGDGSGLIRRRADTATIG
ncbi:MAG: PH domain-containing protein [Acidobacteriota bacterium]|nr:PH domain-containing protein [Acidobacteriota bacterium]